MENEMWIDGEYFLTPIAELKKKRAAEIMRLCMKQAKLQIDAALVEFQIKMILAQPLLPTQHKIGGIILNVN